jgi:uncharacterized membrane protein
MKKYFLTGLAILLPIALTFMIVIFFVNLLTKPFLGFVDILFSHYSFIPHYLLLIISKILILLFLATITILVGAVARVFLARLVFRYLDYIFHKIPGINRIYKGIQEAVKTIFREKSTTFSSVVLVPYPHPKSYIMGLVMSENLPKGSDEEHMGLVAIFVPGAPNPTFGFMLLFKREQLIFIDMKVEDALKYIVSCGVMFSGYDIASGSRTEQDISAK